MTCKRWSSVCMLWLAVICLSISCVQASLSVDDLRFKRDAPDYEEGESGNGNQFLDEFFDKNKHLLAAWGLDPLNAGTIDICSDCVLTGLSTIHRARDATINIEKNGDVVFDVTVGFSRLDGQCSCVKKILFLTARGDVEMQVRNLQVHMVVRVMIPTVPNAPVRTNLDDFEVVHLGYFRLNWDGKGFLGTILQWMFGLFRSKIERKAQELMPDMIRTLIVQMLDQISQSKLEAR